MRRTSRRKEHAQPIHQNNLNGKKRPQSTKNETRALVVIEQTKVRKKYIQGCKRTIKDLDKAKKEWEEYVSVDVPKYEQWYNNSFGQDLSQIREAQTKAQELHSTLQEIRYWINKKNISPYDAYKLVMDRKANPEKYRAADEAEAERDREREQKWNARDYFDDDESAEERDYVDDEEEPSEEELKMMFEFFIQANPSIKNKMKDKAFYDFMFERFKEDVLGKKSSKDKSNPNHSAQNFEERIKAIYRTLVRKLHPDFQKETSQHLKDLWNEVQLAYKANDLERLETILAISNIQTGDFSEEISVSQILNVQSEYKSQLKSLRSQIRKAKKNPQWGFSKIKNTTPISKEIKSKLKSELSNYKFHIQEFEEQLKAWSKPMVRVSRNRYIYV